MAVSVYVSTLTSLAIAIDRYFVIVHPFKARMKLSICMFLIGVIWIVSISISLPYAIYMELQPIDNVAGNSTSVDVKCQVIV
jgi:neuropeptide Y receptor